LKQGVGHILLGLFVLEGKYDKIRRLITAYSLLPTAYYKLQTITIVDES